MGTLFKALALVLFIVAVLGVTGCATPQRGPVALSESAQRAKWKGQHCGLGVSFAECEERWQKERENQ